MNLLTPNLLKSVIIYKILIFTGCSAINGLGKIRLLKSYEQRKVHKFAGNCAIAFDYVHKFQRDNAPFHKSATIMR